MEKKVDAEVTHGHDDLLLLFNTTTKYPWACEINQGGWCFFQIIIGGHIPRGRNVICTGKLYF